MPNATPEVPNPLPMKVRYSQQADHLQCQVSGSYDLDSAASEFERLLMIAYQAGTCRVLIDHRQLLGDGTGIEKALYGFRVEQAYNRYRQLGGPPLRLAFLSPVLHNYNPAAEIGRTIAEFEFNTFVDADPAMNWLLATAS